MPSYRTVGRTCLGVGVGPPRPHPPPQAPHCTWEMGPTLLVCFYKSGDYLEQFNPILHHPRNGHACGWRGAPFGLAIPPYHPDPRLFYKGGVQNGHLCPFYLRMPLPIRLQDWLYLPNQLPDEALIPLGFLSHCHWCVNNSPHFLGNTLVPEAFPREKFGYCLLQGGKPLVLLGFFIT